MKLPKHSLPKQVNKTPRSAKHKDSAIRKERVLAKTIKANQMEIDSVTVSNVPILSQAEKDDAKSTRKRENLHKNHYKRNILHMTNRRGPRAVNGGGF